MTSFTRTVSLTAIFAFQALLLGASAAWAHPDHSGSTQFGLSHYVVDPFHAVWVIGIVALAAIAWRLRARTPKAVPREHPSRPA